jgi:oligoribonuclease NrnB/cAMP/cGMP phosphodiesterase (DHH superfamily)
MKFFHISHTDLDGYGCQLISKKIYPDGVYLNANYGAEVKSSIDAVLAEISLHKTEDIFFLISDLNLTLDESKRLNRDINKLNNEDYKITLQLLDHHATGKPSSLKYDWYFLDTTRSATKIVFDYFTEHYIEFDGLCSDTFKLFIEAIDDVDIWHEDDEYFEFGKVAMRLISNSYEINPTMFPNENRNYRLKLLNKAMEFIDKKDGHILLDDDMQNLKKDYLKLDDKNDTIDNLMSKYLVYLLEDKKDHLTIYYKEHKGLLTFTLSNISIPANTFLKANPDYDFFVNIGRRGSTGFRATGNIDVSILASKLNGGGGHPNASGGLFKDFKETNNYGTIKDFFIDKLNSIS